MLSHHARRSVSGEFSSPYMHRYLSRRRQGLSSTTGDDATASVVVEKKRPRSRKPLSLSPPKAPRTTRDRIRWLQDYNQVLNDGYYSSRALNRQLDDMTQTAQERLDFVRAKIFSFWDGAGAGTATQIEGGGNSTQLITDGSNSAATTAANPRRRPRPVGLKMDGKWWFWNIAFSLLPATLIAAYCELIAKPEMVAYNKKAHILAKKQVMGDDYNPDKDPEFQKIIQEGEQQLAARFTKSIQELSHYFLTQIMTFPKDVEDSIPSSQQQQSIIAGEKEPNQKFTAPDQTSNNYAKKSISVGTTKNLVVDPTDADAGGSKDAQAIEELKKRLEELEGRLKKKQEQPPQQQNEASRDMPTTNHQPPAPKSRIHARVMNKRKEEVLGGTEAASSGGADSESSSLEPASGSEEDAGPKAVWWKSLINKMANSFAWKTPEDSSAEVQTEGQQSASNNTNIPMESKGAIAIDSNPQNHTTSKLSSDTSSRARVQDSAAAEMPPSKAVIVPKSAASNDDDEEENLKKKGKSSWWSQIWPNKSN